MPSQYVRYIESWKNYFPDYEIIRWDESNFPISDFLYAQEALNANKWAFVSDVARVYALYTMGGVYFDTDVEVIKDFSEIIKGPSAILGTESIGETIGTGFMAFEKNHDICRMMIEYYEQHKFSEQHKNMANTIILANILKERYGIEPLGKVQKVGDIIVYPPSYFTAFDGYTGKSIVTEDTYCIHHFSASWQSNSRKIKIKLRGLYTE